MKDDTISRKAAMRACGGYLVPAQIIKALPPVTPKQRWIPCSERLPEVKQKVLVQYADESMATKRCNDAGHLQVFYANAVAWMPAPAPYKGENNESD